MKAVVYKDYTANIEIIDIENTKISLSIKKLQKDPWVEVASKYTIGQKVKGKVLKVNPFGAFIELDNDIHGLVHISELSAKKVSNPEDLVTVGKDYEFTILTIEPKHHRLGLSLKGIDLKKETKKDDKKDDKKKENKKDVKEIKETETKKVKKDDKKEEKPEKVKKDTEAKEAKKEDKKEAKK